MAAMPMPVQMVTLVFYLLILSSFQKCILFQLSKKIQRKHIGDLTNSITAKMSIEGVWCVCFAVVDFFNRVNVIYGVLCEFCNSETCPVMSGGPK